MSCPATSSGLKTSDGIIFARPCRLISVSVGADGTNAATAILYDNASAASGTVVAKVIVDAGLTHENLVIPGGIECSKGLYLDINGIGAEAIIAFAPL